MRFYLIVLFYWVILVAFQCNKYIHSQCINSKIASFQSKCCNEGASVKSYLFQNAEVFCFDPGICGGDLATYVLNNQCDTLGFLGGIMGNSTINGEPFSNAVYQSELWSN